MSQGKIPQLARISLAQRPAHERRDSDRSPASLRVIAFSRGQSHAATLVEIGAGGAKLQSQWEPNPTDPVTLSMLGPSGPQNMRGRILRVTPGESRAGIPTTVVLKFVP